MRSVVFVLGVTHLMIDSQIFGNIEGREKVDLEGRNFRLFR